MIQCRLAKTFRKLSLLAVPLVVLVLVTHTASQSPSADARWPVTVSAGGHITLAPQGATTPEDAATGLFAACLTRSPKQFVQVVCLGVCDGPVDMINKYAECLHTTQFRGETGSVTTYDLQFGVRQRTPRVVASRAFDPQDREVAALRWQMMSTYYGEAFACVEVAVGDSDADPYSGRIVVAKVKDRWYAIPRCRSSRSFYQIADDLELRPTPSTTAM